jgi:DNA helicase-2/ATP-dependent DNA helicase PcrA
MTSSDICHKLNESQKKAVMTSEGPLLIVAGPGTGKTLTIVHRIAYLISQGVSPENILSVTFTNRAAKEMFERADGLLEGKADKIFIGTFHFLGLKIIRDVLTDSFVIYNRDDQIILLKSLLGVSANKAHEMADRLSRIKSLMDDADDGMKGIYESYQSALMKNSAFDFDDLILKPIEMFNSSDLLEKYRSKFKYIIVDEYQDINQAQYRLLKLLADNKGNICAVGDSDQAIYAFRGADVENFLNFERDFKDTKVIHLTHNYRSTGVIVNASGMMIKNNLKRINKELYPTKEKGKHIAVISVPDDKAEGETIIKEIEEQIGGTSHYQMHTGAVKDFSDRSYGFSDFAVIFRTNAQARAIEEAFITSGIPYQVIGGSRLLKREETNDIREDNSAVLENTAVADFINELKLLTPADAFDPRADAVTLMTLHMAKGLEFKIVFVAGVEDGLIPYTLNKDAADIEEERRLFYVGMTRAMDGLFLIHARNRFLYGQRLAQAPSPFLKEIPEEFIEKRFVPDRIKKQKKDDQIGLF